MLSTIFNDMKVSTYIQYHISHTYTFNILIIILFTTDTFRANYGKWFGLGVEDYDKYKDSLRRVRDEGEGEVLVTMDVGDVEEGLKVFVEREVYGWDELVRFFFVFSLFSLMFMFVGCKKCVHVLL